MAHTGTQQAQHHTHAGLLGQPWHAHGVPGVLAQLVLAISTLVAMWFPPLVHEFLSLEQARRVSHSLDARIMAVINWDLNVKVAYTAEKAAAMITLFGLGYASMSTPCPQQELPAMLEYLGVSKRICLYLARKNAQQTIDHLVYEVSLQLLEDEGPATAGSSGGSTTGSAGYQHHRAGAPLEFAAVLQQHTGDCNS